MTLPDGGSGAVGDAGAIGSAGAAVAERAKPPMAGRRFNGTGRSAPKHVVALRVDFCEDLLIRGLSTREVARQIEKAAAAEKLEREKRAQLGDARPVPYVWGDSAPPLRTCQMYCQRAKQRLAEAAQETKGNGAGMFGMLIRRNNLVFSAAVASKNWPAANRANELMMRLCGLDGGIKLDVTLSGPGGGAIEVEHRSRPASMTADERAAIVSDIMLRALQARAAARGEPIPSELPQPAGALLLPSSAGALQRDPPGALEALAEHERAELEAEAEASGAEELDESDAIAGRIGL